MADSSVLGRPLWYELLTTDMKAAEKFYSTVVGWTAAPFEGSPQPYSMFKRPGGTPVAGLMTIPQGMNFPPHWGIYVGVPKLEDAVSKIEHKGGSALSPVIEVPTVGRMRTVKDPQGATFSVYEPASAPQPEHPPEVGDASWHELNTTDAEAGLRFYSELFGWRESMAMDMGPMGKYHMFGRTPDPAGMMGGIMNKPKEMEQVPPHWAVYFRVPDINAAAERIKANGGKILNGPMEVPGDDWIVNAMDPQGAAFALHQRKAKE
jgi:predicted enzyme related to lactoylglutathione lyase